jgi:hypothetical protein
MTTSSCTHHQWAGDFRERFKHRPKTPQALHRQRPPLKTQLNLSQISKLLGERTVKVLQQRNNK